jgi:hypothetical protein
MSKQGGYFTYRLAIVQLHVKGSDGHLLELGKKIVHDDDEYF